MCLILFNIRVYRSFRGLIIYSGLSMNFDFQTKRRNTDWDKFQKTETLNNKQLFVCKLYDDGERAKKNTNNLKIVQRLTYEFKR